MGFAAELTADQLEFFEAKVRPILAERCYKCHSLEQGKSKGSLTLDTRDGVLKGGETGPALVAGDPEKSLLIEAVRYKSDDLQMPPDNKDGGGKLPAEKIAVLEQWVKIGAPDPRVAPAKAASMDMTKARQHWAFQLPTKPARPAVKDTTWVATPIDAFVLAKLEAKNLKPAPAADARTLLRRVTYDLTGLPPTPEEMEAFQKDFARDPQAAYATAVDRLLASPRYGERWGRFWLDVARYADTKGYLAGNKERRYAFSHTYRDYVIKAFNDDKPFDRFIVEQLAADQLPLGEDKSPLAALGFLTLGRRFLGNPNDIIDDRIDVVTRGLMGLTVTCARCHDHKFDPIPTADYYSLHGVFASSDEPEEKPLLGPLVESPAYEVFLKKTAELEEKIKARSDEEIAKFLSTAREKTGDYLLAAHDFAQKPAGERLDLFAGVRKVNLEILKRWQTLLAERAQNPDPVLAPWFALAAIPESEFAEKAPALIAEWKPSTTMNASIVDALVHTEKPIAALKDVAVVYNKIFADVEKGSVAASASERTGSKEDRSLALAATEAIRELMFASGAPPNLPHDEVATMLRRQIDTKVSGLRREIEALNWTEPGAPLRAMAMTDRARPHDSHILLRGNPANQGPEVPRRFLEILDGENRQPFTHGSGRLDLATDIASPKNPLTARVLVNRVWGWHFGQPLVRTPSDFGVRTEAPLQRALLDWLAVTFMENNWSVKQLHRAILLSNTYRQSSEASAATLAADPDNALVSRFNRHRLEFEAMRDTLLADAGTLDLRAGGLPDDLTKEPFATRRTVYGFIDRQNLPGMFRTFDFPNPDVSSAQRLSTTVPQQALFMLNSSFVQEQARALARRIGAEKANTVSDSERVQALYRVVLQRGPTREETALAKRFLSRSAEAAPARTLAAAGWQYGYGRYDAAAARVRDFKPMNNRKEGRLLPGAEFPDATFARLSLTSTGGHPGKDAEHASIRRWTAPATGKIKIEATLTHPAGNGDGVRGRIVSSEGGCRGEWTVRDSKAETKLELDVHGGETIDFIVDCLENPTADSYTWAPTIMFTPDPEAVDMATKTWNARKDFEAAAKPVVPLTRWEELAQVLMLSNEAAFVD